LFYFYSISINIVKVDHRIRDIICLKIYHSIILKKIS